MNLLSIPSDEAYEIRECDMTMSVRSLFAGLLMLAMGGAHAMLVSGSDSAFSWTTDTTTGLDWLDFDGGAAPNSVLRPKDDVAAHLVLGGDYAGWRFATNAEVYQLILDATGFPSIYYFRSIYRVSCAC